MPVDETEEDLGLQKQQAYERLATAWEEAIGDGVDPDILAHVALFAALRDLVDTYGEGAVAEFAGRLPERVTAGEFSVPSTLN